MRALDILLLASRQLRERRLRSVLTMLTVAVGVTTIISLSAQVEGARVSIVENLGKLGPDTIVVTVRGRIPFTDVDVSRLRSLEGVSKVIPMSRLSVRVSGLGDQASILAVSSAGIADTLGEVKIMEGVLYYDVPAPQAVVGRNVAVDEAGETRFRSGQPLLAQIGQRQVILTVVGVLEPYGTFGLVQPDDSIFIPAEYYANLVRGGGYTFILIKALDVEVVDQVSEMAGYVFGGRGTITSVKRITETVTLVTSQINVLLFAIAGTSFIAAGLGTLNIMMISVLERVREIGVLKALGMKDRGVLSVYLTQGILIGIIGSLLGLALGWALAQFIPGLAGNVRMGPGVPAAPGGPGVPGGAGFMGGGQFTYTPIMNPTYIIAATAASLAVTLLASAYPAWRASRLRPVEALRYE